VFPQIKPLPIDTIIMVEILLSAEKTQLKRAQMASAIMELTAVKSGFNTVVPESMPYLS
jgi:hypothetical protein